MFFLVGPCFPQSPHTEGSPGSHLQQMLLTRVTMDQAAKLTDLIVWHANPAYFLQFQEANIPLVLLVQAKDVS